MDRDQLLRQLPEKQIMDRLIMRYFTSMSPSQRKLSEAQELRQLKS
jgi:hypothetical protein